MKKDQKGKVMIILIKLIYHIVHILLIHQNIQKKLKNHMLLIDHLLLIIIGKRYRNILLKITQNQNQNIKLVRIDKVKIDIWNHLQQDNNMMIIPKVNNKKIDRNNKEKLKDKSQQELRNMNYIHLLPIWENKNNGSNQILVN